MIDGPVLRAKRTRGISRRARVGVTRRVTRFAAKLFRCVRTRCNLLYAIMTLASMHCGIRHALHSRDLKLRCLHPAEPIQDAFWYMLQRTWQLLQITSIQCLPASLCFLAAGGTRSNLAVHMTIYTARDDTQVQP